MRIVIATALLATLMAFACSKAGESDSTIGQHVRMHKRYPTQALMEYRAYHANGVVKIRGTLVNGNRIGLWVHVDSQGFICGYEDIRPNQTNVAKGQLFVIAID